MDTKSDNTPTSEDALKPTSHKHDKILQKEVDSREKFQKQKKTTIIHNPKVKPETLTISFEEPKDPNKPIDFQKKANSLRPVG